MTSKVIKLETITIDDMVIYTDGSSLNNGKSNSKAGYGVYSPSLGIRISKQLPDGSTNNIAELSAIIEALEIIKDKKIEKVIIVSDSKYCINCLTKWAHKWKKNGWTKKGGIKNLELIKTAYNLVHSIDFIKFAHIHSHTGIEGFLYEGNKIADKLAGR